MRIKSEIVKAARKFLERKGFIELFPSLIADFPDPGIGEARFFEFEFSGIKLKLLSALTLYKPYLAKAYGRIFALLPSFRLEPIQKIKAGRHLLQFYQLEVEMEGRRKDAIKILERLLAYIVKKVKKRCKTELEILGRKIRSIKLPLPKLEYEDALKIAKCDDYSKAEEKLSKSMKTPFFVTGFPIELARDRGFPFKSDGGKFLDFDLILPEGYGECATGSEREDDKKKLVSLFKKLGLKSYLKFLKKFELARTAGFGLGIERLCMWICGLKDIRYTTFPPQLIKIKQAK